MKTYNCLILILSFVQTQSDVYKRPHDEYVIGKRIYSLVITLSHSLILANISGDKLRKHYFLTFFCSKGYPDPSSF